MRATMQDLRTKLATAEKSHDEVLQKLRDVQFTKKTLQNQYVINETVWCDSVSVFQVIRGARAVCRPVR